MNCSFTNTKLHYDINSWTPKKIPLKAIYHTKQ